MQNVEPNEKFEEDFECATRVSYADFENYLEPSLLEKSITNFAFGKGESKSISSDKKSILIQIGDCSDDQEKFPIKGLGLAIIKEKEEREAA